jgi:hypothetical protein
MPQMLRITIAADDEGDQAYNIELFEARDFDAMEEATPSIAVMGMTLEQLGRNLGPSITRIIKDAIQPLMQL